MINRTNDFELNAQAERISNITDIRSDIFSKGNINVFESLKFVEVATDEIGSEDYAQSIRLKRVNPRLNKKSPLTFARFNSFEKEVLFAIEDLILYYPASIRILKSLPNTFGSNVFNVIYDPLLDETTFNVNNNYISNPFGIFYVNTNSYVFEGKNSFRNLAQNFYNYDFYYNGTRYPVLDYVGSRQLRNDFIKLKVKGKVFDGMSGISIEAYITPNLKSFQLEKNKLSDLALYMLGDQYDLFYFEDDGEAPETNAPFTYDLEFKIPRADLFNLQLDTNIPVASKFIDSLVDFAKKIDQQRADLLQRLLVPKNISFNATDDTVYPKMEQVLSIWGREYDNLHNGVKGLQLAKTFRIESQYGTPTEMYDSLLYERGIAIPKDTPIFVKENLLEFSTYLAKTKGTRASVEFIRDLCSIPQGLYEFNEYIFTSNRINFEALESILLRYDGAVNYVDLLVNEDGTPRINNTINRYFELFDTVNNNYYFDFYRNLASSLSERFRRIITDIQTSVIIYENDFVFSGATLRVDLSGSTAQFIECVELESQVVDDPLDTVLYDDCGCELDLQNRVLENCLTPIEYTGCTEIRLDAWYDCIGNDQVELNLRVIGGEPPYDFFGALDGEVLNVGQDYIIRAGTPEGCLSNIIKLTPFCFDPCSSNNLELILSYACEQSIGNNTGDAVLSVQAQGGTPPYSFTGALDGDVVENGQIVTAIVADANGCIAKQGLYIDCPPFAQPPCNNIELRTFLETVSANPNTKISQANLTYELRAIPAGVFIDTMTVMTIGVGATNTYLIGTPVTTNFTTTNGAVTYSFDFNPDNVPLTITLQFSISILLTNGCEYSESYSLTVNPRRLSSKEPYNEWLTPL